MNRCESIIPLYNGTINYYLHIMTTLNQNTEKLMLTKQDVVNALYALISLDILYNKEIMIDKNANLTYKSNMSDETLNKLLLILEKTNNRKIFQDGTEMLVFIRNKLAHGDYYIDNINDNLVFTKDGKEIYTNLSTFLEYYTALSGTIDLRIKDKIFTKEYLEDRSKKVLTKPIETDSEIDNLLSLMRLKKYTLKRLDGEELSSIEKEYFVNNIEKIKELTKKNGRGKEHEQSLIKAYADNGYIVDINKEKINKKEKFEQVKQAIVVNNEIHKIHNTDMKQLAFDYGESIYKVIKENYTQKSIDIGIKTNEFILRLMYKTNLYDLDKILQVTTYDQTLYITEKEEEILASLILAKFYAMYCFPLEKLYINNINYNYNREKYLDFGALSLDEIKPTIININHNELDIIKKKMTSLNKKIVSAEEYFNKLEKDINGLTKKSNRKDKENKKLEEFKESLICEKEKLNNLYEEYLELQQKYLFVKEDYENNHLYFRNLAIIEGIRNAISHGNVGVKNVGRTMHSKDILIHFKDVYEGNVYFELTASLYTLESLFEKENTDIINKFIFDKLDEKQMIL